MTNPNAVGRASIEDLSETPAPPSNLLESLRQAQGELGDKQIVTMLLVGLLPLEKPGNSLGQLYETLFDHWRAALDERDAKISDLKNKNFSKAQQGVVADASQKKAVDDANNGGASGNADEVGQATPAEGNESKVCPSQDIVTGLLVCQRHTFVHFIETSERMAKLILRHASSTESAPEPELCAPQLSATDQSVFFPAARLLYYSDSLERRIFPIWQFKNTADAKGLIAQPLAQDATQETRFIGINESEQSDITRLREDTGFALENLSDTVTDVVLRLILLGQTLQNMTSGDLKVSLNNMFQQYRHLLPEPAVVHTLATSDNVLSLKNYSSVYVELPQVTLESELTWPMLPPAYF